MKPTTHDLLEMIAALRQRVQRAHEQAHADEPTQHSHGLGQLDQLRLRVETSSRDQEALDRSLRSLQSEAAVPFDLPEEAHADVLPAQFSARAIRLLKHTRQLLTKLRTLGNHRLISGDENHPAAVFYHDSVLLANVTLRSIHTLPAAKNMQMRLASGLDVLLTNLDRRIDTLAHMLVAVENEHEQLTELRRVLQQLHKGVLPNWDGVFVLADTIAGEANDGKPLVFCTGHPADRLHFVAAHSLTTARVIARVACRDAEWRSRLLQPIVAALVHDVGMSAVPRDLLAVPDSLHDEQKALLEKHTLLGARWIARTKPKLTWLADAARGHHERPDGQGYPAGVPMNRLDPLVRLLAVCDVYASLCCPRPQRRALDTAAALHEIEQMAERQALPEEEARLLSQLSPYPPGIAVECSDGRSGVVETILPACSPHLPEMGTQACRQVIRVLTDADGTPLPFPQFVEAGPGEYRAPVRCLDAEERRQRFSDSYPQWT